jgi:protein-histidine pros-kinase
MGIRAKFNIAMLLAFGVGLLLAGVVSYTILRRNARDEVMQQAALMISEATAARDYTASEVGPLLGDQTKIRFLPQSIPFWAAQTTFRSVQKQFPDYSYKEAALNPTNPADRATDWEADIIDVFKRDATLTEFTNVRNTPAGAVLVVSHPVRLTDKDCLDCHSVPSAAPASMLDLYGPNNGFGWKLGDVVGAQIVTVPMEVALSRANRTFIAFIAGLTIVFAVMLVLLNLLLHYSVIKPIRRIAAMAADVSLGNMDAPEIEPKGKDEVAQLTEAFNRMRRSLTNAMRMLAD